MKGYTGKILFVNLSTGQMDEQTIPDEVYENFLSGAGLGAYMLYKHIPPGADPLGPENVLGFVSGLLTGTASYMTGRWMAVCKSPLTGGYGDANCGGNFSPAIKQCGYDGIFFKGIAARPVYLYIDRKGAQLRDAAHVWGKDASEAEDILVKENMGKKPPRVAVIGTAGEKLSLISGIMNDHGRIAARSGVGAVMGSKKLKAVVVSGSKLIKYANVEKMKAISKAFAEKSRNQNLPGFMGGTALRIFAYTMAGNKYAGPTDGMMNVAIFKKFGTAAASEALIIVGDSPVKNWAGSRDDFPYRKYSKVNPDPIVKRETEKYHCYACAWGCGAICNIKNIGQGEFSHTHRPEYETICSFGSLLLNDDVNSIFYINELLNRAGMDSISAGSTVAFALECYQHGLLTKADTDGLELTWGNTPAIVALVKKMIAREGIGDLLADGSRVAARKIGKGAEQYAITAGGQEPGMHDPRYSPEFALLYSADPTPGRHTTGCANAYPASHLWEVLPDAPAEVRHLRSADYIAAQETAQKSVLQTAFKQVTDGAGGCSFAMEFGGTVHWKLFDMLNAATGWEKSPADYIEIGQRIQTLRQMFNIKHGINPRDNIMHPRMTVPLQGGATKGKAVSAEELNKMVSFFWKGYGWDETNGQPTQETIQHLGLNSFFETSE